MNPFSLQLNMNRQITLFGDKQQKVTCLSQNQKGHNAIN